MMDHELIIKALERNARVFHGLLVAKPAAQQQWRPAPEKWSLLEIVCHLYDEEIEDFRMRVFHVLNNPGILPPMFDPVAWVSERKYNEQNYDDKVEAFLQERERSVALLRELQDAPWNNSYEHPKLGVQTAEHYLANWLAHDHLHMRQIIRYKFEYWKESTGADLSYAGDW